MLHLQDAHMEPIVPPAIEEYCLAHSSASSALLQELHAYTSKNVANAQMLIGPLEAAFLQLMVRATGTKRVLEIGTFTGYSALAMAAALPTDGAIITCEVDAKHAEIAKDFFAKSPDGRKITLRFGAALDTLRELPPTPSFDFVFVDADKENYINYYEQVLPRLRTGGLIVADNVLWSGRVLTEDRMSGATQAIVRFNDHVRQDPRIECVMVPLRDGVSLIRKR